MQLATLDDLHQLRDDIIKEIRSLDFEKKVVDNKWVKSKRAREILTCSPGTLQNLRLKGLIEFSKVNGTIYYSLKSILQLLETNKQTSF